MLDFEFIMGQIRIGNNDLKPWPNSGYADVNFHAKAPPIEKKPAIKNYAGFLNPIVVGV